LFLLKVQIGYCVNYFFGCTNSKLVDRLLKLKYLNEITIIRIWICNNLLTKKRSGTKINLNCIVTQKYVETSKSSCNSTKWNKKHNRCKTSVVEWCKAISCSKMNTIYYVKNTNKGTPYRVHDVICKVMEPWKPMRWHSIQKKLSLRAVPLGRWIKRMGETM
jgi:hypothetical protein